MKEQILLHDDIADILKENGPAVHVEIYRYSKRFYWMILSGDYNFDICETVYTFLEKGFSVYVNGKNIYKLY